MKIANAGPNKNKRAMKTIRPISFSKIPIPKTCAEKTPIRIETMDIKAHAPRPDNSPESLAALVVFFFSLLTS